jgi:hypothetical protein
MLKGVNITLLMGPVVPIPVPREVVDALVSVQVTTTAGKRSGFQLTFNISTKSALNTVLTLLPQIGPTIRTLIILTMNGVPTVLMDGLVAHHQVSPNVQTGQSTLVLSGEDLSSAMDLVEFTGLPYPAMPAEARVALIVAKYAMFGMIPLVIPSLFMDVPIPTEQIPVHQGTDLAYVVGLADDAGYVFYVDPGPAPGTNIAYWGPQIKIGIPQPALNVNMDAFTNVESLNFSFNASGPVLPVVFIQNKESKISIPLPIPSIGPLNPPLGVIPPLPSKVEFLNETAKLSPMAALSKGLALASTSADAVTGNGTLDVLRYGRILKARGLVGVRGAGQAYDGLYYVQSVTHNLKRGEYKQSFTLTRNGLVSITPVVPV